MTFRGAIRERTFHVLFLLALFLFFVTPYLAAIAPRQGIQVALDFIMSIVSFVGLILVMFIGSNLITRDIDKKTIYSVITKPIPRSHYVMGRFLGMAFVLFISILLLTAFGLLSFYISVKFFNSLGDKPNWFLFGMNLLFSLEMLLLLVSASFLISSVSTSSFLPFAVTIAFYYAGQSMATVKALLESWKGGELSPVFKAVVNTAYYLFPNLALFDFKAKAAYDLPVPMMELLFIFLYGIVYTMILLLLTIRIFNKRDIA
jgi:Cu-processing system permease protein